MFGRSKMVRKKAQHSVVVGKYRSRRRKYDGKLVYQLAKNKGTSKGWFKRSGRGGKAYVPKKYKRNVVGKGVKRTTMAATRRKKKQYDDWLSRRSNAKKRYRSPTR